jgi:hypothetical protein
MNINYIVNYKYYSFTIKKRNKKFNIQINIRIHLDHSNTDRRPNPLTAVSDS